MYNKRGFKKSKTTNYRKKRSMGSIKKMIRSEVLRSQETKEVSYNYSIVAGASFGSISYGATAALSGLFGAIAQGSTNSTRIGNSIYARGVNINMAFQNASADVTNQLRILLVQPHKGMASPYQPNLVSTFIQSVLSGNPSGATQWLSPVDTNRWQVLLDKTYYLKNTAVDGNTGSSAVSTRFLRKFIKINKKIQWDESNVINNDVYLIGISDSAAIPNPGAVGGFVKVYYKDA